jgi:hypothetical protein
MPIEPWRLTQFKRTTLTWRSLAERDLDNPLSPPAGSIIYHLVSAIATKCCGFCWKQVLHSLRGCSHSHADVIMSGCSFLKFGKNRNSFLFLHAMISSTPAKPLKFIYLLLNWHKSIHIYEVLCDVLMHVCIVNFSFLNINDSLSKYTLHSH